MKILSQKLTKSRRVLALVTFIFALTFVLTSCKQNNKTDAPNEAVKRIDKMDNKFIEETLQEDIRVYKEKIYNDITANTVRVSKFKASIDYEKANTTNNYKNQVALIEKENIDLKNKIGNYVVEDKQKWEMYKIELSANLSNITKQIDELKK